MSPLPVAMRDRWKNRPDPAPGQGTVYWHALMSRYPQVQAAAGSAQDVLREFDGFHLTPAEWFHMTVLVAGPTEKIPLAQLPGILEAARSALRAVPAPAVTVGRILYHPEAIMLAVEPVDELRAIRRAVDRATSAITGASVDDDASNRWIPHITVGYSTDEQPAAPIVTALGTSVEERALTVAALNLVVQWGPERAWDWEPVGKVQLTADN